MGNRITSLWLDLVQGLWFIPTVVAVLYAALAFGLVQLDEGLGLTGVDFVFQGDQDAARTVLSVLAGSLITVAGLTFSITVVVLQLASSQFSPRVLRTFFDDRLTQITAGTFIGIFVYSLIVLRAVGSFGTEGGFVPRLSITIASALGVVAVGLLIVFIHHIAQMIQVSQTTASIGRAMLAQIDEIYPEPYGEPEREHGDDVVAAWRDEAEPGLVHAARPGYVQRVGLDELVGSLDDGLERLFIAVRPGDFVPVDVHVAEIWPASLVERCDSDIRNAVTVGGERDMGQDLAFGFRQLTDIAMKALSPSVNDPTTAYTCIGYLRSALTLLAGRRFPAEVRRYDGEGLEVVARRREFAEHVEAFAEIGRYIDGDARVAAAVLQALDAVVRSARTASAEDRVASVLEVAEAVGEQALDEAKNERDRARIEELLDEVRERAGAAAR